MEETVPQQLAHLLIEAAFGSARIILRDHPGIHGDACSARCRFFLPSLCQRVHDCSGAFGWTHKVGGWFGKRCGAASESHHLLHARSSAHPTNHSLLHRLYVRYKSIESDTQHAPLAPPVLFCHRGMPHTQLRHRIVHSGCEPSAPWAARRLGHLAGGCGASAPASASGSARICCAGALCCLVCGSEWRCCHAHSQPSSARLWFSTADD